MPETSNFQRGKQKPKQRHTQVVSLLTMQIPVSVALAELCLQQEFCTFALVDKYIQVIINLFFPQIKHHAEVWGGMTMYISGSILKRYQVFQNKIEFALYLAIQTKPDQA